MSYYVHIKGILGLQTDADDFIWLYGKQSPAVSKEEFDACLVKLRIHVTDDKRALSQAEWMACDGKFLPFAVNTEENALCYDRGLVLGKRLRYRIEVKGNEITATVSRSYYKYVKLRVMNIHSVQHILSDIVTGVLLRNGYLSLYCSSVYFPDIQRCALIFSAPGVGKTTTCMELCEKYGGIFVSEDVALTDGDRAWSVPWTNSKRTSQKAQRTKLDRRINDSHAMEQMMKQGLVCDSAQVTDVFLLERGNDEIVESVDVMPKVAMLNHYLFHYRNSPAVTILDYFLPAFSLYEMESQDKEIHEKLLSGVTQNRIVMPEGQYFTDAVYRTLYAHDQ